MTAGYSALPGYVKRAKDLGLPGVDAGPDGGMGALRNCVPGAHLKHVHYTCFASELAQMGGVGRMTRAQELAVEIAGHLGLHTVTASSDTPEEHIRRAMRAADQTTAEIAAIIEKHFPEAKE